MENKYGIVGVAHVGLPTNDLQKTVEFYKSLGFEVIMQTYNEKAGEKVAFLQIKNYCIETFENGQAAMSDGAYQHVALDVEDIESMYQKIADEHPAEITSNITKPICNLTDQRYFSIFVFATHISLLFLSEFCQKL